MKTTISFPWKSMAIPALALTCVTGNGQDRDGSGVSRDTVPNMRLVADPSIKDGEKVTLTGKLQGGIMAIGGETTGWRLAYTTSKGKATLEVNMKDIKDAGSFDGKQVMVSGTIITRSYVERGTTLILQAEKVVLAEAR